ARTTLAAATRVASARTRGFTRSMLPSRGPAPRRHEEEGVKAFQIDDVVREREHAGRAYLEFLRVPDLSLGLYVLPAGGHDAQSPHTEDEAYYVISDRARMRVADELREVGPGSILFVEALVPHQ